MPAFKKFGPGDQVDNVLILQPAFNLVSGAAGWRGAPNGSASLSLYGGARRSPTDIFTDIRYQVYHPGINQFGQAVSGQPLTASINSVYVTNEILTVGNITATRWGKEHWDTIQRLYNDYSSRDQDYVTSSYDYYCLYFQKDSNNMVSFNSPRLTAGSGTFSSGSWTLESWIKPILTSSITSDFTIASMNRSFWFGITGSTGQLTFSSSVGSFTSSFGPKQNTWSHVSVIYDSLLGSASFRINLIDGGTFAHPILTPLQSFTASFTIGNQYSGSLIGNRLENVPATSGAPRRSFNGMIGETRYWFVKRTDAQMSSSFNKTLISTDASGAFYSVRLNEGPSANFGDNNVNTMPSIGSGTINQSFSSLTNFQFGYLVSFSDRSGPVWLPNDNIKFYPPKNLGSFNSRNITNFNAYLSASSATNLAGTGPFIGLSSQNVSRMSLINIPSAFYGRQITPNSINISCNAYSASPYNIIRTIVDDGRGGLYISGSMCSSSLINKEDYAGVMWNKVGNVFYSEGLIVIKDQSLLDFGRTDGSSNTPTDTLQLSFRGDSRIPVKTLMCRIDHGEFNCSTNPTFYNTGSAGERLQRHPSGSVRVTTVGLYNADRELVGVARFADPVRIRSRDRINLKLRMDF
jgi:hypothetical protein